MKYTNWLNDWLENYIRPSSKIKTYTRYVEIVDQHIKPNLGEYEMDDLSSIILQKHITQLLQNGNLKNEKGLAPNSVNSIISIIQGSLSTANRLDLCKTYSADKIQRPKSREKQVTCFTLVEQKKIEQAVRPFVCFWDIYGMLYHDRRRVQGRLQSTRGKTASILSRRYHGRQSS